MWVCFVQFDESVRILADLGKRFGQNSLIQTEGISNRGITAAPHALVHMHIYIHTYDGMRMRGTSLGYVIS